MQDRQDRVQWVYASKNNSELESRYNQWAEEYESDLDEAFGWSAPEVAVKHFAKHVASDAKILACLHRHWPCWEVSAGRRL